MALNHLKEKGMKRILLSLTACLFLAAALVLPKTAKASHEMGADLTYECINACTIRVHLRAYRYCPGSNFIGNTISFTSQTPGCGQPQPIGAVSAQVTTEVTPVCPGFPTQCTTPGAAIGGVQEFYWYRDYNICNVPQLYIHHFMVRLLPQPDDHVALQPWQPRHRQSVPRH